DAGGRSATSRPIRPSPGGGGVLADMLKNLAFNPRSQRWSFRVTRCQRSKTARSAFRRSKIEKNCLFLQGTWRSGENCRWTCREIAALALDRKKLAAFSALGGGFLRFPIGDRRCNRTRASVGNAGGNARPSLTNATLAASRLLHRRSPTAVEALKSEVQASPGTRVSNICQGTRLGSSANTGCRERRNTISPTCRRTPTESASGGPQLPPHSKNESVRPWRLLGGPVCASLPNGLESIPGRCSGLAALSRQARSAREEAEVNETWQLVSRIAADW